MNLRDRTVVRLHMLKKYFRRARSLPLRTVIHKAARLVKRELTDLARRTRARIWSTYPRGGPGPRPGLRSYVTLGEDDLELLPEETFRELMGHYVRHEFDILGSGWVRIAHDMVPRGMEGVTFSREGVPDLLDERGRPRVNRANVGASAEAWSVIDGEYVPIDWQSDFRSGFRWSERTWHGRIRYQEGIGADIKMPWELARMHHLPQLALGYALARRGRGPLSGWADDIEREYRNQIVDFVASNPPGFGVAWASPMSVAIRAANMTVSYDVLRGAGARLDARFEDLLADTLHAHAMHILENIEWSPELQASHYLANVVGLLFISAYLERSPFLDSVLAFAIQELRKSVESQFHPDGSNFEASTCYHASSSEMVVYGAALVLALPEDKVRALESFDAGLIKWGPRLRAAPLDRFPVRLVVDDHESVCDALLPHSAFLTMSRMADFIIDVTKPNGRVAQVGDNDSSRFLNFHPACLHPRRDGGGTDGSGGADGSGSPALLEDHLDHRHLVSAIAGLFGHREHLDFAGAHGFEGRVVRALLGGRTVSQPRYRSGGGLRRSGSLEAWLREFRDRPGYGSTALRILLPDPELLLDRVCLSYEDFGYFIVRSPRLFLGIRCGSVGQLGTGGHAHNDQLSIELNVDGRDVIADPGTYVYSSFPRLRNRYRSITAHFAPCYPGSEPISLDQGLFALPTRNSPRCLYFGVDGFAGAYEYGGRDLYRIVSIHDEVIEVTDLLAGLEGHRSSMKSLSDLAAYGAVPFSAGYGEVVGPVGAGESLGDGAN